MTLNKLTDFFKSKILFKLIIFIIFGFAFTLYSSPKARENLFYLIETKIFYRQIPPIYNDDDFKSMEPNKVCGFLNSLQLNGNSYSRSHYFDFACESPILVSSDSSWNIQYVVSGKLFNASSIVLKMDLLKTNGNYDNIKEMIPFVSELFKKVTSSEVPDVIKMSILSLEPINLKLSDEVSVRVIASNESVSLIFY
jgi:hypothetical protein